MEDVVLRERRGSIEILTVNRPKALNALNSDVLNALDRAMDDLMHDEDVRCVILTGSGGKAFVAGADIVEFQDFTPIQAERFSGLGQDMMSRFAQLQVPIIAAVDGYALGAGTELAMSCDFIIAGEKARFGQPEVKLGVIPGFAGTQRLTRRVGLTNALDLITTGRQIDAQEALRMGLVSRVVEGDVLEATIAIAEKVVRNGPNAVRMAKRAIHENADCDLATAQMAERSIFSLCFASSQQKEGCKAFLEKRAANFQKD